MAYAPRMEYEGCMNAPADPYPQFDLCTEGIYPKDVIERLRGDAYDPVIIGYDHFSEITTAVLYEFQRRAAGSTKPLKVALELDPEQLQWIRDFLCAEAEFLQHGSIKGERPSATQVTNLTTYRIRQLYKTQSQHIGLWLLENGFDVVSIEHADMLRWVEADKSDPVFGEPNELDGWGNTFFTSLSRMAYTAIRRDIHGLRVIDEHRPDIISVGSAHAIKYDMLLRRDGRNSLYFLLQDTDWRALMQTWKQMHDLYRRRQPSAP